MTVNPGAASTWLEKACDIFMVVDLPAPLGPRNPRIVLQRQMLALHNFAVTESLSELL